MGGIKVSVGTWSNNNPTFFNSFKKGQKVNQSPMVEVKQGITVLCNKPWMINTPTCIVMIVETAWHTAFIHWSLVHIAMVCMPFHSNSLLYLYHAWLSKLLTSLKNIYCQCIHNSHRPRYNNTSSLHPSQHTSFKGYAMFLFLCFLFKSTLHWLVLRKFITLESWELRNSNEWCMVEI